MTTPPSPPDLGKLYTVDGRTVLRFERRYRHPREKVWRAITEPRHIARWFPAEMEFELRPGAPIRYVFPGEEETDDQAQHGTVREVVPPELLEFTWGSDVLRWELLPDGDGCLLRFTNTFDDRAGAGSFATGWTGCLDALGAVLAGEPIPEPSPEQVAALHEAYVSAFDLDAGTVRNTLDGWRLRFERQLMMVPVAAVWDALTGATPPKVGQRPPDAARHPQVTADAVTTVVAPTGDWVYLGGTVTAGEPQAVLEYASSSEAGQGQVRWELYPGPGGARIVLTQTGPAAGDQDTALAAWHHHLELLVARVRGRRGDWSDQRVSELRRHYATSGT